MNSRPVGERIDGVSAELHGLSLLCEQLAEELTGRPGPRSQNAKVGQPNSSLAPCNKPSLQLLLDAFIQQRPSLDGAEKILLFDFLSYAQQQQAGR